MLRILLCLILLSITVHTVASDKTEKSIIDILRTAKESPLPDVSNILFSGSQWRVLESFDERRFDVVQPTEEKLISVVNESQIDVGYAKNQLKFKRANKFLIKFQYSDVFGQTGYLGPKSQRYEVQYYDGEYLVLSSTFVATYLVTKRGWFMNIKRTHRERKTVYYLWQRI